MSQAIRSFFSVVLLLQCAIVRTVPRAGQVIVSDHQVMEVNDGLSSCTDETRSRCPIDVLDQSRLIFPESR